MPRLKAVFLCALLSVSSALADASQSPDLLPCWPQPADGPAGAVSDAARSPCTLFVPPVCRQTDPTCSLFWLLPVYAGAGPTGSAD